MIEIELIDMELDSLEDRSEAYKKLLIERSEELTELKRQHTFIIEDSIENTEKVDRYLLMYKQTLRELEETKKQLEKSEELRMKMREAWS